jgi:hypothetical protein
MGVLPLYAQEKGGQRQAELSIFNPAIAFIGNFTYRLDDKKVYTPEGERIDDHFFVRTLELDARAPVDPFSDAVAIIGFEQEGPEEVAIDVEEAYVMLKKIPYIMEEPLLGLKLKLGRYFIPFGRAAILHTHDLPFTQRPLVIQEFLGSESISQETNKMTGISGRFFLPTPWDQESVLEANLTAMNGGNTRLTEDGKNDFAYLGELRWFRTFSEVHNLDLGLFIHYGVSDREGDHPVLTNSLELLYKWKPLRMGEFRSFLVGGQVFYADREFETPVGPERETPFGYYTFAQYQFDRRIYGGIRWDYTQTIDQDRLKRRQLTPYISVYLSEFLRCRFSYEYTWSDLEEENGRDTFFFELNFIFGAHPPEPYWVNK